MTVAVYQGENAEETWKCELAKYTGLRHPNIVQLYGAVNSGGLYATIFHDNLVPFEQFMHEYRHSVISAVYLYGYFDAELRDAEGYFESRLGAPRSLREQSISWIRCSTGRLCVEVAPFLADYVLQFYVALSSTQPRIPFSSLGPSPEMSIISSLTLNQFHDICYYYLSTFSSRLVHDKMQLGGIVSQSGEGIQEIVYIPNFAFRDFGWKEVMVCAGQIPPINMDNGWSRFHSSAINGVIERTVYLGTDWACWLSQANHVFSQLVSPRKHEDCCPSENLPEGYLLLCPLEDLRDNDGTFLQNPECPGYWSLNPSGIQRLSPEEVSSFGFPCLELEVEVSGYSWDEDVYAALSRFHAGKGFDPNSQDLAQHLRQPLYKSSCGSNVDTCTTTRSPQYTIFRALKNSNI
ncbi:hypothetical protein C8R44DRAFT_861391 [Mycena epipterygia]|nr:hypothetical protein C8R44DRAFT_861391 [Mycena epipterygia]